MIRFDPKWILTLLFVALGPLGTLLTPHYFPSSFRIYYFLLPLFPIFYFAMNQRIAKIGIFLLPFLTYCFVSANIVEMLSETHESHILFRFFLFLCQFLFTLGAAAHIKEQKQITTLLKTYLRFYFISLIAGYILFFGYYLNLFSLDILTHFTVLTQFGFGILRFSPGSYPNEYGIVSSFILSLLALIYLEKRSQEFGLSNKTLSFFFLVTLAAFLLTTTRAAYLSFLVSILYINWTLNQFLKTLCYITLLLFSCFGLPFFFDINLLHVFTIQNFREGSLGERFSLWTDAINTIHDHSLLGAGFASLYNAHNVYLQLIGELGLIGTLLLLGSLGLITLAARHKRALNDPFLTKLRMIGLINILSFAASNHNLNHHLTWFVLFLCMFRLQPHKTHDIIRSQPNGNSLA